MQLNLSRYLCVTLACVLLALQCYGQSCGGGECAFGTRKQEISDHTLLLPSAGRENIHYTIEAYDGCFTWVSENESVASVLGLGAANGCSVQALITVTATGSSRRVSAQVTATNINTGAVLRTEVFVAPVHSLSIETRTRSMFIDDIERLDVVARDLEGNRFSTVRGLPFHWELLGSDAAQLDTRCYGRDAGSAELRASNVGAATVTVALEALTSPSPIEAHVDVVIMERLRLTPSKPVYITPNTLVQYTLQTVRGGHVADVAPSEYRWELSEDAGSDCSTEQTGTLQCGSVGTAILTASRKDMPSNAISGTVHVVEPAELVLRLVSGTDQLLDSAAGVWYFVRGHTYEVEAELQDRQRNALYGLKSRHLRMELASSSSTKAGSVLSLDKQTHSLEALATGTAVLKGAYQRKDVSIHSQVSVVVTEPLAVGHHSVLLPEGGGPLRLSLSGGSGSYVCESVDPTIAVPSIEEMQSTALVVSPGRTGESLVRVYDAQDPDNSVNVTVRVQPVVRVAFFPQEVEKEVGLAFRVTLVAIAVGGEPFDGCSGLPLAWEHDGLVVAMEESTSVAQADAQLPANACETIYLKSAPHDAQTPGSYTVRATLAGITALSAATKLYEYSPLEVSATNRLATLGSTVYFSSKGGPSAWPQQPTAFRVSLVPSSPAGVKVRMVQQQPSRSSAVVHSFAVDCTELGTHDLALSVTNTPTTDNPLPAKASVAVSVICDQPTRLVLRPLDVPEEDLESVRDDEFAGGLTCTHLAHFPPLPDFISGIQPDNFAKFSVRNERELAVGVWAVDAQGMLFDNFSSIPIEWNTSEPLLAWFTSSDGGSATSVNSLDEHGPGRRSSLVISQLTGEFDVWVQAGQIRSPTLTLDSRSNVRLSPPSTVVFNNPMATRIIHAEGGSGLHYFTTNDSRVALLSHDGAQVENLHHGAAQMEVRPAGLGVAVVEVVDRCVEGSRRARSIVEVADVSSLSLRGPAVVKVGQQVQIEVVARSSAGVEFPPEDYQFMGLQSSAPTHNQLELVPTRVITGGGEPAAQHDSRKWFVVKALAAGEAVVTVRMASPHRRRGDEPELVAVHNLKVRPRLAMHPSELTLVPRSSYQLRVNVPRWDSVEVEDPSVCQVDPVTLRVRGIRPGSTSLVLRVRDEDSGELEETRAAVAVTLLKGIQLHSANDEVLAGREMSVRVMGEDGESPFAFTGFELEGLAFRWSSSNEEVLSISSPIRYHQQGHHHTLYPSSSAPVSSNSDSGGADLLAFVEMGATGFTARLRAVNTGVARVTVEAHMPDQEGYNGRTLSAAKQVTVVQQLMVLSPSSLLLPRNAVSQIKTNKDAVKGARLTYRLLRDEGVSSLAPPDSVLSVSSEGLIETKNTTGSAFVLVRDEQNEMESVLVKVQVEQVHQLQVLPVSAHFPIPLGATAVFQAVLRDRVGDVFTGSCVPLQFQLSEEVADVRSGEPGCGSVSLRALRSGSAILRVYAALPGEQEVEDYVSVSTGEALSPPNPVVAIGGSLRFSTKFEQYYGSLGPDDFGPGDSEATEDATSEKGAPPTNDDSDVQEEELNSAKLPAVWSLRSPESHKPDVSEVLAIDSRTGQASANKAGSTQVYHTYLETFTEVLVVTVEDMVLNSADTILTNAIDAHSQRVKQQVLYVDFFFREQPLGAVRVLPRESRQLDHGLNLTCRVSREDVRWASAHSDYDEEAGAHVCVVTPRTCQSHPIPSQIGIVLSVSYKGSVSPVLQTRSVPYHAAFWLMRDRIELTSTRRSNLFTIHSRSERLQVIIEDGDSPRVAVRREELDKREGLSKYNITVKDQPLPFENLTVVIRDLQTGQEVSLDVSYTFEDELVVVAESPRRHGYWNLLDWVLSVWLKDAALAIVAVILAVYIVQRSLSRRESSAPAPADPAPSSHPPLRTPFQSAAFKTMGHSSPYSSPAGTYIAPTPPRPGGGVVGLPGSGVRQRGPTSSPLSHSHNSPFRHVRRSPY